MLVKESLKLHSAEQLEIKQEIEIDPEVSKSRYSVESYFFFPAALYINKETYSEADFRRPLKSYVRLRLPRFRLSDFMAEGGEYRRLKALLADPESSVKQREAALKRYALLVKGAFKRRIKKLLESGTEEEVEALVEELRRVIAASRPLLLSAADPQEPALAVTARAADEYLFSNITESVFSRALTAVSRPFSPKTRSTAKSSIRRAPLGSAARTCSTAGVRSRSSFRVSSFSR